MAEAQTQAQAASIFETHHRLLLDLLHFQVSLSFLSLMYTSCKLVATSKT